MPQCAAPRAPRYQRRRPEKTLWYRTVQAHFATWLELSSGPGGESPPAYVERTFRRYLDCGSLAYGFARTWCDTCQYEFRAYSGKGRGDHVRRGAWSKRRRILGKLIVAACPLISSASQ